MDDLDILVGTDADNLARLERALDGLGLANLEREVPKLASPLKKLPVFGVVDIFSSIAGFDSEALFANAVPFPLQHSDRSCVNIISLADLIAVKAASSQAADRGEKAQADRDDLGHLTGAPIAGDREPGLSRTADS